MLEPIAESSIGSVAQRGSLQRTESRAATVNTSSEEVPADVEISVYRQPVSGEVDDRVTGR